MNFPLMCCRIGLGTLLAGARIISDGMLQAAAEWYFHIVPPCLDLFFPLKSFLKSYNCCSCIKLLLPHNDFHLTA